MQQILQRKGLHSVNPLEKEGYNAIKMPFDLRILSSDVARSHTERMLSLLVLANICGSIFSCVKMKCFQCVKHFCVFQFIDQAKLSGVKSGISAPDVFLCKIT